MVPAEPAPEKNMSLASYTTLGRSGLRVSPLCLGTMTFGTESGWGADEASAGEMLDAYVEAGGNFVDTADGYTGGRSEEILGKLVRERGLRDRMVIATKFTFNTEPGNPNGGGNGRKNIHRAIEGSLRRLGTDYVDLYWMHAWDTVTPVEEVMAALDDLVRAGKVLHVGLSDVPAWYAARYVTLAEQTGRTKPIALQLEYSLVERTIEREHVPAARELGLAITPWSPLASGFLTGKYGRDRSGEGRLAVTSGSGNPAFEKFTEPNWRVLDELLAVAAELDRPPAEVALAWVVGRPGVGSTLVGATRVAQLRANLAALELALPTALRERLDAVGAPGRAHPYMYFSEPFTSMISGGVRVTGWNG